MDRVLILIFLLFSSLVFSQIEVKKEKLSFHDLLEWKGVLLIAEDEKGKVDDKELTRIAPNGKVQWRKVIYPKSSTSYLIHSKSSDYIYFVDDLKPENSVIRYNQINESGSVTPTKLNILPVIRDYGYRTPDEIVVENIVNTPNALVFHLTLEVKEKDIIENFFVTITHHNNRVYHWKGPETRPEQIDEGKQGPILYAGCDEEAVYFARYTYQANNHRVNFIPFDAKAKPLNAYSYSLADFQPILSTQKFYSNEGRYYIDREEGDERTVRGLPIYHEGSFLYVVNDASSRELVVYGANKEGDISKLATSGELSESKRRYDASLGICRNGKEITICAIIEDNVGCIRHDEKSFESVVSDRERMTIARMNPSILQTDLDPSNFVYNFDQGWHYISRNGLNKLDILSFTKK